MISRWTSDLVNWINFADDELPSLGWSEKCRQLTFSSWSSTWTSERETALPEPPRNWEADSSVAWLFWTLVGVPHSWVLQRWLHSQSQYFTRRYFPSLDGHGKMQHTKMCLPRHWLWDFWTSRVCDPLGISKCGNTCPHELDICLTFGMRNLLEQLRFTILCFPEFIPF